MARNTTALFLCLIVGVLVVSIHAQESSNSSTLQTSSTAEKKAPPNDAVVMKVGGVSVTKGEFDSLFAVYEGQETASEAERKKFADQYATALMLSQQAIAHHLDSTPDVLRQLALDHTQILPNAEFARLDEQTKATPEEISQYYNAHLPEYDVVELHRIFVWKKREGGNTEGLSDEGARAKALAIRQALVSGGDAKKLMSGDTLNTEPTPFQRPDVPAFLQKPAFELKEGEWSGVLDTPDAAVLVRVTKRWRRGLKEMSPSIQKKLHAEKLRASLDALKKTTGVWIDESYLSPAKSSDSAEQKPLSHEVEVKDKQ